MQIRKTGSGGVDKVEQQMTPMIDIVFQLLTFFLFSFKISAVEGDFNVKMPAAATASSSIETPTLPLKVRLTADAAGNLAGIQLNDKAISDFAQLHANVISIVGKDTGPNRAADESEVELDCDYNLKYMNVVKAITSVSGYLAADNHVVKLIQKIKFSPPKRPGS